MSKHGIPKQCFVIVRNSNFDWFLVPTWWEKDTFELGILYHKLDANKKQYILTMRTNKNRFFKFGQNDSACINRKTAIQRKQRNDLFARKLKNQLQELL